ncbi:MAG: RNA polymerase sigma factor [Bacilli bacterium]
MILSIRKAKKGDKEALTSLILERKVEYYRLAYSYMRNEEDAKDCLQDMMISLYKGIGSLREEVKFYTWSKTILVNICKKKLGRKITFVDIEESNDCLSICSFETSCLSRLDVERCIDGLSEAHQDVVHLRFGQDMKVESIGEVLGIGAGTIKSRLHYALSQIRNCLGG